MLTFGVALASGAGAVTRYLVDVVVVQRRMTAFPWGTLVVNVSGSFALGVVAGLAVHQGLSPTAAVVLGVGFAGGYTTLSTWAWESLVLLRSGEVLLGVVNVLGSFAAGLVAAAAGLGLALL